MLLKDQAKARGHYYPLMLTEEEIEDHGEDHNVHQQLKSRVSSAQDDVEGHPEDQEPACPVVTVENEDAGDDSGDA